MFQYVKVLMMSRVVLNKSCEDQCKVLHMVLWSGPGKQDLKQRLVPHPSPRESILKFCSEPDFSMFYPGIVLISELVYGTKGTSYPPATPLK